MDSPGKWYPRIGLEIHAELNTKTKVFCSCKNDPDETRPNMNVCPVCMGYPGALPVLNKEAVRSVLKLGLALGSRIADFTEWDRKNYFYPDIPKGYQISQYKHPLLEGGELRNVAIHRVHLEEDTARSKHDEGDKTIIDYNRSGVPLMELVTEPVIRDASMAGDFARSLQLLLQYLNIAEANMEKGEMRVEANISVSDTPEGFGTKVEVKNLNSFRSVERAIAFEIERHIEFLSKGENISQETRGWDDTKQVTFSQRSKEEAHDYRYFPEPDIPKLFISEAFDLEELKKTLPELPQEREKRYISLSLKPEDAEQLVNMPILAGFFDEVMSHGKGEGVFATTAANYILSDLQAHLKDDPAALKKVTPQSFVELIELLKEGSIGSRAGKDILKVIIKEGGSAKEVAEKMDVFQTSDMTFINTVAEEVIKENESVAVEYKNGKETALQFLVGQGMKKSKGKIDPTQLANIFKEKIK